MHQSQLVASYYRLSPPLADLIRDREWLRATVRVILTPVIWVVSWMQAPHGSLILSLVGFGLLVALGVGGYRWRLR